MKYKAILGFSIIAIDVSTAEKELSAMVAAAKSLEDLKPDLFGLKIVPMFDAAGDTDGVEENQ